MSKWFTSPQALPTEGGRRRRRDALKIGRGQLEIIMAAAPARAIAGERNSLASSSDPKLGRNKLLGGGHSPSLLSSPGDLRLPNNPDVLKLPSPGDLSSPALNLPRLPLCPSAMMRVM